MIIWWVFLGVCALIYGCYDAVFKAPERNATRAAQQKWERDHFNGWRLHEYSYDTGHGLLMDELNKETCSATGYPGYPACPMQQYFVNGLPSIPPAEPTNTPTTHRKRK